MAVSSEYVCPIVSMSKQGGKPINEDCKLTWISPNKLVKVGGVFDGHGGINGLLASYFCTIKMTELLDNITDTCEKKSPNEWAEFLSHAFEIMHIELKQLFVEQPREILSQIREFKFKSREDRRIDFKGIVRDEANQAVHGGTTATICVNTIFENTSYVITANCGDSEAFIINLDSPNNPNEITTSHSADNAEEYKRIRDLDPEKYPKKLLLVYDQIHVYDKYKSPQVFNLDGSKVSKYVDNPWKSEFKLQPSTVRYDPATYAVSPENYDQRDKTCISFTRTIGDFYAHPLGLTYIPTIKISEITDPNKEFVVIGSDGIWDCWKYEEFSTEFVSKYIQMNQNQNKLTNTLIHMMEKSEKKANELFGTKHRDDQTIVVMKLLNPREYIESIKTIESIESVESRIANEIVNHIIQQVLSNIE